MTTQNYTLLDVEKAIIRAGASLGWQMEKTEPGKMTGTLNIRTHMAKVIIAYDKQSYAINYQDSTDLNYNGTTIHSNYNRWIQNLDRAIQTNLSMI